jgi:hypothetical protein
MTMLHRRLRRLEVVNRRPSFVGEVMLPEPSP